MVVALLVAGTLVPSAAASSAARPFHGTIVGGAEVAPEAACPIGLKTLSWATGAITHLGLADMESMHCTPNPPFGDAPGAILGGQVTLTAANGDTLAGTYAGTVNPFAPVEGAIVSGEATATITGGTGRFADASGTFEMSFEGVFHPEGPMTMTWILDGAITY